MASTYDSDERSVAQNRPIDLYTITTPTATYRITSHPVDVLFGGNAYSALTMSRGNLQVGQDLTGRELVVYLPIDHPFVQRFVASGIPEHGVVITLLRMQAVSAQAIQQWSGFAQSIAIEGHTAMVRVPSVTDDAMKVRLPVISGQRICNHALYDSLCTINRTSFTLGPPSTIIVSQTDNTILLSSFGALPDNWATFGEALHPPTAQRRMILQQIGANLTLNAPFVGVSSGDSITVFAGCDHSVFTCRDKFSNAVNFGGLPDLNSAINPWAPKSLGIVQQT